MSNFKFILALPSKGAIDQNTVINFKSGKRTLQDESQVANFIYLHWKKETASKSLQDWADELNSDTNYENEQQFTAEDALDNIANTFVLNINGKYVELFSFLKPYIQDPA